MIYELRVYETAPGRMPALHSRFADHSISLFKKHGFGVVGFWTEEGGAGDKLYYILSFKDVADREKKWKVFRDDPEWQRAKADSEKDGTIVAHGASTILAPTPYSPMK